MIRDKVVCDKIVCDKVAGDKVVCTCDKVVCVCVRVTARRRRGRRRTRSEIQNQKQEPHTKMWETSSRLQNPALATLKHHVSEGGARSSACGCLCLTNVAIGTKKKVAPKCSLQASKTLASPHRNAVQLKDGPDRTRPSACGCLCLTLLSEPTKKIAAFKPPKPWPRHAETLRN